MYHRDQNLWKEGRESRNGQREVNFKAVVYPVGCLEQIVVRIVLQLDKNDCAFMGLGCLSKRGTLAEGALSAKEAPKGANNWGFLLTTVSTALSQVLHRRGIWVILDFVFKALGTQTPSLLPWPLLPRWSYLVLTTLVWTWTSSLLWTPDPNIQLPISCVLLDV